MHTIGSNGPARARRRKNQQRERLEERLAQAGAWTLLPAELEDHILVITLGAHVRSSWRLILQDVAWLHALGVRPVLVQGSSSAPADEPRADTRAALEVLRTALCGQVNQELLTLACGLGERAVALSGVDGQMVRAHAAGPDPGIVGHVHAVNPHLVEILCAQGYVPIIAPLGQGPEGTALFIDADRFAAHLACALDAEILVALDNAPGVQRPDGSLISELGESEGRRLLEAGAIRGELVPRVSACLGALVAVPRVHIADGEEPHALLHICLEGLPKGTRLVREPDPATYLFWRLSPAQDAAETSGASLPPHTQ
jgi:acetylglutamate kinase